MRSRTRLGDNEAGGASTSGALTNIDIGAMFVSAFIIGIAVSPLMLAIDTPVWVVIAAAALAWSGTGEIAYASVIAAGGSMAPAMAAALLVSSRFGLLAMSLRGRWKASIFERVMMHHYASEVAVANAIDRQHRFGSAAARRVFWQFVAPMASGWVIGSVLGVALVELVNVDTKAIGLDVAFPASFVGSVIGGLRNYDSSVAVIGGAGASLALTPVLPAGLPILIAASMAVVALAAPDRPLRAEGPQA